ncbi:MAG: phenylacetate-CoA oxygenase subunit PaaC [Burkholderiales bacterium]|jgi:ring-1,2-phenylacetyl-CoA epoxidase subunit PaaC|nr:phenylacetate-CoA oxygenase subunit PaaC [Burkholderiales bacterium]
MTTDTATPSSTTPVQAGEPVEYLLHLADTSLILAQRLSEWCGHGPVIEEDIALTNVALDLVGQARLLLTHAGAVQGRGRDEDQLAFLRLEHEYRNLTICELPNQDFGRTILRNLMVAAWQQPLWQALQQSTDRGLAAIAAKSLKETRYHLQHAGEWTIRLGDGTAESRLRMQRALDALWPYTAEFFIDAPFDEQTAASGVGVLPSKLRCAWERSVLPTLTEATLDVPAATPFVSAGKMGRHTEHMGHLLTEMQYLQRTLPGAKW